VSGLAWSGRITAQRGVRYHRPVRVDSAFVQEQNGNCAYVRQVPSSSIQISPLAFAVNISRAQCLSEEVHD